MRNWDLHELIHNSYCTFISANFSTIAGIAQLVERFPNILALSARRATMESFPFITWMWGVWVSV